jgi:hypothetical protein
VGIYGEELDVLQSEDEDVEKTNEEDKDLTASRLNGPGVDATTTGNPERSLGNEDVDAPVTDNPEQSIGDNNTTLTEQPVEGSPDTTEARTDDQLGESIEQSDSPVEEPTVQHEGSESLTYDSNDGIEPGHHENELPPVVIE